LIIEVRDNGCGMDEKTQNHIFEPFFTTKSPSEGTGLGLTLCLNSIEELGGQIEVDSIQGKGSTFRVILPDNVQKKELFSK
jgi:signal transduction histidine kinase